MSVTGLLQVALHADDLDRAEAFYTRLLGAGPTARSQAALGRVAA